MFEVYDIYFSHLFFHKEPYLVLYEQAFSFLHVFSVAVSNLYFCIREIRQYIWYTFEIYFCEPGM